MRAPLLAVVAAAGVAAAVVAPAGSHPGHPDPAVAIAGNAFSPESVQAVAGDTVRWTWNGPDLNHSVTSTSSSPQQFDSDPGDDTPSHPVGHTYAVRFDSPGTYEYLCKVHGFMTGRVVVAAAPVETGTTTGDTTTGGTTTTGTGPPATPPPPQTITLPDERGPHMTSLRFARGAVRFTLDEAARVSLRLYRADRRRRPTGRVLLTIRRSLAAGPRAVQLRTRRRGRLVARVTATDAAGNAVTRLLRFRR